MDGVVVGMTPGGVRRLGVLRRIQGQIVELIVVVVGMTPGGVRRLGVIPSGSYGLLGNS